jgi:hypothetical protein
MKAKKWLLGTVLSLCLLLNGLTMPIASAGSLDEFAAYNFPTIVALQDQFDTKSAVEEGMKYFERWHELVDQGVAKLSEWGDRLKEKGMTLVLDHFSEKIDDYVNENAPLKIEKGCATKIVPVVTIGSKGYIGAAQISGPKEQVDKCKAALTVEGQLASGAVRIQYLVPIDTNKPTSLENVHRVQGVGVSARLDLGFPG